MKKKRNILAYILAVVLIVGGLLALWLPNRNTEDTEPGETVANRPDTDPNAPFRDLPEWEKDKVLAAVEKKLAYIGYDAFWCDDTEVGEKHVYGVRYYGTFAGYYIVVTPFYDTAGGSIEGHESVGNYTFSFGMQFDMFAYKDGVAVWLNDAYEDGLLSDEQIGQIYQCFKKYNEEVYKPRTEEELT